MIVLHRDFCCDRHREWVATDQTINSVAWPLALVTLAAADPRVKARCGYNPEKQTLGDTRLLGPVLAEIGPLCCFLSDADLAESYAACRDLPGFPQWRQRINSR